MEKLKPWGKGAVAVVLSELSGVDVKIESFTSIDLARQAQATRQTVHHMMTKINCVNTSEGRWQKVFDPRIDGADLCDGCEYAKPKKTACPANRKARGIEIVNLE